PRIAPVPPVLATGVGAARHLDLFALLCHNTQRSTPRFNQTFIWLSPKRSPAPPACRGDSNQGRRNHEVTFRARTFDGPVASARVAASQHCWYHGGRRRRRQPI